MQIDRRAGREADGWQASGRQAGGRANRWAWGGRAGWQVAGGQAGSNIFAMLCN